MKKIFIAVFCINNCFGGLAQTGADTGLRTVKPIAPFYSSRYVKEEDAQVIALRGTKKAPFSKTQIGNIANSSANLGQDLPFILQQTPSLVASSDAGNGVGYTGIRIRGTDATRINMTINGVPYNDAESQGLFLVNLPDFASSVNSLEIQRGVGSSSNGAGAFGATLSFSTSEDYQQPFLQFNNSYGSFNTMKNTLKVGTGLQGKMYFTARVSNIKSDGYIDRATSNLQGAMATIGYVKENTDIKFNAILGKEKTYQAWYGVNEATLKNNRTYNSAGTEKPGEPYNNETDNYNQNHYQFIINQKINKYWKLSTTSFYSVGYGYYEQYKADRKYSSIGLPNFTNGGITYTRTDLVRQLWLDNDFFGQTFAAIYAKDKSNVTIGGMASKYLGNHFGRIPWAIRGIAKNYEWYNNDAVKKDNNIYAKWQYDIDKYFSLYTDVQWRNVHYSIDGFRDNPTLQVNEKYNFVNPKLGITYYKSANKPSFSLSYAKAAKEPNRDDFEATTLQLPTPEILHNWEFNIRNSRIGKLKLEVTGYYMLYKNQLILTGRVNDVGAYTRQNVPNSYRAGIELQTYYNINKNWSLNGNVTLSKNKINSYTQYIDDFDNGNQKALNYRNTDIAFSPNVVGAINVNYAIDNKLTLTLLNKFVGNQYLDNTQQKNKMLQNFFLQNFVVNFTPIVRNISSTQLVLQVNNIFNKKYTPNGYVYSYISGGMVFDENYYFPMAGINYMIGLNIRLAKK